jgi:hypothetical protein
VTLSRRDRAAILFALECLRNHAAPLGVSKAWRHGALIRVCGDARDAIRHVPALLAARNAYPEFLSDYYGLRLWRARLALVLRALLRADASQGAA